MRKTYAIFLSAVLIFPQIAAAGFLVSDKDRVCTPVSENPGFGLGGYVYSETCPDGYSVTQPQPPEKPWFVKLLDLLDQWFGLKGKVIWIPTASQLALIASLVLILRRLLQLFQVPFIDTLTHGLGTLVISALVSFLTHVQPLLDGGLTAYEAILALISAVVGSAGLWELAKRLIRT